MGLDQYLQGGYKTSDGLEHVEDAYYWRKANQIHGYFDQLSIALNGHGIENCEMLYLTPLDIRHFINDCKLAVENYYLRGDKDFAQEYFPPTDGFFFGGTSMDSIYWSQLEDTVVDLEKILKEKDYDYFMYYGWW